MFGNKENVSNHGATTLIAKGTRVEGDLHFTGSLEIEGTVVGNVRSDDQSSRVRLLHGSLLEGEIWVGDVVINGHVKGNIYAGNLVKLASKAVIEGNIHYSLIEVEKGAEVVGSFVLEQESTNVSKFPKEAQSADGK
jgi:cytoskeletal protein CcmA (bactofilin family)